MRMDKADLLYSLIESEYESVSHLIVGTKVFNNKSEISQQSSRVAP